MKVISRASDLAGVKLKSCEAWKILPDGYVLKDTVFTPTKQSSAEFKRGIGRKRASFSMISTKEKLDYFKKGDKVKFVNGEVRTIVRINRRGNYSVYILDGKPLDGDKVGYPNEIKKLKQ